MTARQAPFSMCSMHSTREHAPHPPLRCQNWRYMRSMGPMRGAVLESFGGGDSLCCIEPGKGQKGRVVGARWSNKVTIVCTAAALHSPQPTPCCRPDTR